MGDPNRVRDICALIIGGLAVIIVLALGLGGGELGVDAGVALPALLYLYKTFDLYLVGVELVSGTQSFRNIRCHAVKKRSHAGHVAYG